MQTANNFQAESAKSIGCCRAMLLDMVDWLASWLDAFCEDESFAFAKLEEIEWQSIQRGAAALIAAFCSLPDGPCFDRAR